MDQDLARLLRLALVTGMTLAGCTDSTSRNDSPFVGTYAATFGMTTRTCGTQTTHGELMTVQIGPGPGTTEISLELSGCALAATVSGFTASIMAHQGCSLGTPQLVDIASGSLTLSEDKSTLTVNMSGTESLQNPPCSDSVSGIFKRQ